MFISHGIPDQASAPVALTIGNFDGVHLGHCAMLKRLTETARARALTSCVLTFEPHPHEFFTPESAPARLTNLREKLEWFAALGVEHTHICRFDRGFAQLSAGEFIGRVICRALDAKWLLVGDDFRFGKNRTGDFNLLQSAGKKYGFEVVAMPSVIVEGMRVSSTLVRDALARGDLEQAAQWLGRPYSISGRVVHGDKTGRKIGFPTANIRIKHARPALSGIFAVELAGIGERALRGVASLGVRPTVKENDTPLLEVYIFDFDREIYGNHVRVDFLHKLRNEEKYSDLETLRAQIGRDVENAKFFFNRGGRGGDLENSNGKPDRTYPALASDNQEDFPLRPLRPPR
ncbi:MAG TPA: bifunctional riboflavin kinase/FAD synthetase [Burkholderiales bacterium]|nr:bifunctional riboflavin kinase/FAD synthetase [Burkholderiales bacterium]